MSVMTLHGESGGTWHCYPDRQIGNDGGFGSVFEGEGEDGSSVAVKLTHPYLRNELEPALLEREREIA